MWMCTITMPLTMISLAWFRERTSGNCLTKPAKQELREISDMEKMIGTTKSHSIQPRRWYLSRCSIEQSQYVHSSFFLCFFLLISCMLLYDSIYWNGECICELRMPCEQSHLIFDTNLSYHHAPGRLLTQVLLNYESGMHMKRAAKRCLFFFGRPTNRKSKKGCCDLIYATH